MRKFHIIALDKNGEIIYEDWTETTWSISELEYHIGKCKADLSHGKIKNLIIESEENDGQ